MKVAIIGGGLSGLAAAYELNRHGVEFKLFEPAHHFGGNMRTLRNLDVGGTQRWVDLGVNDFSKTGYTQLVAVLDQLGVAYKPLLDETSYSTIARNGLDSEQIEAGYAIDGRWETTPNQEIKNGIEQFRDFCEKYLYQLLDDPDPSYEYMTVGQFVEWAQLEPQFVTGCLYPRILGMFFTSGVPPEELPIRVVIHYYYLQEGLGRKPQPDPQRMYWVNGCRSWVDALCQTLDPHYADPQQAQRLLCNVSVQFKRLDSGQYEVYYGNNAQTTQSELFDTIVMARQAWDVCSHFTDAQQIRPELKQALEQFKFSYDKVYVHTATNVLPLNTNCWRTYNLALPPHLDYQNPANLGYSITYACNQHQNDPANPEYNWQNPEFRQYDYLPQFFLSINPRAALAKSTILRPRGGNSPCDMFAFRHNIMDMQAFKAQQELLPALQGKDGLYLVGGYTTGVGLQEECWIGAVETVRQLLDTHYQNASHYQLATARRRLPSYIAKLAGVKATH